MELSERKKNILATVVRSYVCTGEPVGSKALCDSLGVSSATVRNEMSELAELGYLTQPHTSAGRVPTDRAFRLYIDCLMEPHELTGQERELIDSLLPRTADDFERTMRAAAKALSAATRCAALVTSELSNGAFIRKVELVPMTAFSGLLVLVTSTGAVRSRMCRFPNLLTPKLLDRFSNLVSTGIVGTELGSMHPASLQTLVAGTGADAFELTPLISALAELIEETADSRLELTGETRLLSFREFTLADARGIFELFSRSDEVLALLDAWGSDSGVIIGSDTPYDVLERASMVLARYTTSDARTGYIGVIGPTRMDYDRMLPSIEYFADSLGALAYRRGSMKGLI